MMMTNFRFNSSCSSNPTSVIGYKIRQITLKGGGGAEKRNVLQNQKAVNCSSFNFIATSNVSKPILKSNAVLFNPYPGLGCPSTTCWPRGFPLSEILDEDTWKTPYENFTTQMNTFAVLQSLADIQPDVDAIYRMTQKTPFIFKRPDPKCK